MKIHHLRNATSVIETSNNVLLIDPMLGPEGSLPPFTLFRFKARKNPTVPLPHNADRILQKVTHCIITHRHPDHLDRDGITFLRENKIPVLCSTRDKQALAEEGLDIVQTVDYWETTEFSGIRLTGIPAQHGYGFVTKLMGNVMGFYLELNGSPSIYLSSDTVYTGDVHKVLTELEPNISVLACGAAQFDLLKPLLMNMEDIMKFVANTPGKVIANHMESLNHCPTSRIQLTNKLMAENFQDKVFIPQDGEIIDLSSVN